MQIFLFRNPLFPGIMQTMWDLWFWRTSGVWFCIDDWFQDEKRILQFVRSLLCFMFSVVSITRGVTIWYRRCNIVNTDCEWDIYMTLLLTESNSHTHSHTDGGGCMLDQHLRSSLGFRFLPKDTSTESRGDNMSRHNITSNWAGSRTSTVVALKPDYWWLNTGSTERNDQSWWLIHDSRTLDEAV